MLPSQRAQLCCVARLKFRTFLVTRALLLVALASPFGGLVGCGGGSNSPTQPSQIAVSVSPSSASVLLGTTKQFMANVSGTTDTVVTWSVNGTAGGNSTTGTIDANGLYTAPSDLPSPAGVTIAAASQVDGTTSQPANVTITSDIAVSATTNPTLTLAVPTGSTVAVAATILSQGKPDQKVSWSVNGIANGNSTVGTVSSTGVGTASYQAPTSVPTPFTVNITATAAADPSKSASIPMIVAGTIASASQNISAATGGTITLPDGSSVTIAPGVLPSDQSLTVSEVSYLPEQPPNTAITGAGAGLILTFESPVQPSIAAALKTSPARVSANLRANTNTTSAPIAFQFSINTASNNVALLNGSLPSADFLDAVGTSTFTGVDGNYDSTAKMVTGNIRTDLLAGFVTDAIASIQFGAMNIANPLGVLPLIPGPVALGLNNQNQPDWVAYSGCPTGNTLVVVHGMVSSVQSSFPPATAQVLQLAGSNTNFYETVVGFNYDWLQSITTSGAALGSFLDTLASCGVTIDIEAHSEGVPVSMAALIVTKSQTNAQIKRLVCLGGPIMGTPAANDVRILQSLILADPEFSLPAGAIDLATILGSPFVTDLETSMIGDGSRLDTIRSSLSPRFQQDNPQLILAGGTAQRFFFPNTPIGPVTVNMSWAAPLMGTQNFDGIIPLTSALAFDSNLKAYPLPPFPLGHTELVSNPQAIEPDTKQLIGQQVAEARTPALLCAGALDCEALRTSSFQFAGNDFDPSKNVTVLSQDLSGAVVRLSAQLQSDGSGNANWIMPQCSQTVGVHSVFGFDGILASNDVMQAVDPATCAIGTTGNITTIAGTGVGGYSGDNGPASNAHLFVPSGIAFDPSGNMFIADSSNSVIRRVDAITHTITTVAGTGVPGFSGDNGPAGNAQLNDPTHVVFDRSGNLYITDAQNERIRKVNTSTGTITTVAGNGTAGFSGDGGPATSAELNFPDGVGLDASDNVYIGDALNNRIRKLDVTTGIITTVAGTGVAGFSGDGGLATNAQLNFPSRPALDAAGNLYIADFQNNRVRRVDATTHVIVTVAGTGTAAYSGDGGAARDADLNGPISVTVDTSGNLYIGDINNARIRVVNTGTSSITIADLTIQPATIVTIAGNGIVGYQGDGGAATSAELNFPTGLLLDPAGNLYFADAKNNVVRVISLE
jgi:sugar lactone lactonase YvrE